MKWILAICSFLSLILSLAVCVSFSRYYSIDIYSFIISILTLLVALLIGFQIYNAIEVHKKLNEMQRIAAKAAYEENERYNHTTMAVVYYINAIDYYKRQNISEKTIDGLFCCIEEALKGKFQFPIDMAINYMLDNIPSENFFVQKSKKEIYMRILYKINNDRVKEVITKIESSHGI